MKNLFVSALSVLSLAAALPSAHANVAAEGDAIVVSGLGQIAAEPNMAFIEAAVVTEAKTVKEAQQLNATKFNAATEAVRTKFSLAKEDLMSSGYSVSPVYDTRTNGTSVLRGYSVRHAVKITVRKLTDLGGVVDLMGEAGINQLSLIRFSHNNKRDFEMKALAMAMEDSRGKAEVIARATGRALARATRAEYHTSETPEAVVRGEALREASDATEFIPGEIVIRASVSVTYEF